ncbi:hypothetical protein [Mesorhizobium sp. ESP-6-2]|uniref:hypothetical protein n=1 Tax=Mesorhizobium sp. ESP-6-2 TaxID=2876625 RepID=UPI001CCE5603|nr:hypothetical protein [Mesorhizobium sp. ESP-6-2]MBZ9807643.1 hypothetical protein [Mesorhizobium sp. ESP-6-2]
MSNAEKTAHTPTERAMKCAIEMELHAACSSQTIAKAQAIDDLFPAYDDILSALESILFEDSDKSEADRLKDRLRARFVLSKATGDA